jgi:hypothetical protein
MGGCATCGHRTIPSNKVSEVLRAAKTLNKLNLHKAVDAGGSYFDENAQRWCISDVGSIPIEVIVEAILRIKTDPMFVEAYNIAKANTDGGVFLVGGKVYRNLISVIYKIDCGAKDCDWDFLTAKIKRKVKIPKKWCFEEYDSYWGKQLRSPYIVEKNRGFVQFIKHTEKAPKKQLCKIDLMNIKQVFGIKHSSFWRRTPTIENYFDAVPMTIQAIAFDPVEEKFLGTVGLQAILEQKIGVNNHPSIVAQANHKEISIPDILKAKAETLFFDIDWPDGVIA